MNNYELYKNVLTQWGTTLSGALNKEESLLFNKYITQNKCKILEAGCGGGRISFALEDSYNCQLDSFDYIDDFIENAKAHRDSKINFFIADATNLSMLEDNYYDYTVYLQRIIDFIPYSEIQKAISEAYRVTKKGGVMICSVLNYEGRWFNPLLSFILGILRNIRKEDKTKQELPWLRINGKPNYKLFKKDQPTIYWFRRNEFTALLKSTGYEIIEEYIADGKETITYYVCIK
ncbi:MAG: class I SAM-dependent methyltransferase [Clostridia bacterium]|nr:class I SAM-dependent methyltransferase [Clostridia bacterium]